MAYLRTQRKQPSKPKIQCPKCGFRGTSVHYFNEHPIEVVIAFFLTVGIYFIMNINVRACPECGNHRGLLKLD